MGDTEPESANPGQRARPSKSWVSDVEAAHAE